MPINFRRLTTSDFQEPSTFLTKLNEELRQVINELNRLGGFSGTIALVAAIDMGGNTIHNLSPSPQEGEQDAVGREFADSTYSTAKTIQQIGTQLGLSVSGATGSGAGTAPGNVASAITGSVLFIVNGVLQGDGLHLFFDDVQYRLGINTAAPAATLDVNGSAKLEGNVGFFGTTPTTQPTVTGSRGGNAALASLLTGLAGLGLIVDSSSP